MSTPVFKTCEVCGKPFKTKASHLNRRRTCSRDCLGQLYKTELTGENNPHFSNAKETTNCPVCNKSFEYYPSARPSGRPCCSFKCAGKLRSIKYSGENNPLWAGGKQSYYGPNWLIHRDAARQRDAYTCQQCGITEKELGKELDVHHIKPFKLCADYLEANSLPNLTSLCHPCHKSAEVASWAEYGKPRFKHEVFDIQTPWLTPQQAANIIGLSVWGVYAAIRRNHIKAKNLCAEIETRQRPRFVIHIDDARAYKKRYSK